MADMRMIAKIKNSDKTKYWQECKWTVIYNYITARNLKWYTHSGKLFGSFVWLFLFYNAYVHANVQKNSWAFIPEKKNGEL